jgi:hypothetical protein
LNLKEKKLNELLQKDKREEAQLGNNQVKVLKVGHRKK